MESDARVVLPLVLADVVSAHAQANDFLKLYVAPPFSSYGQIDPHDLTLKLRAIEDDLNSLPTQLLTLLSEPVAAMLSGVQENIAKVRKRYEKLLASVREDIAAGRKYDERKGIAAVFRKKWKPKDLGMALHHVKHLIEMASIRLEPLRAAVSLTTRFFDAMQYLTGGALSRGDASGGRSVGVGVGVGVGGETGGGGRRRRAPSPMSTVTDIMSTGSWGGHVGDLTGGEGGNGGGTTTRRGRPRIRAITSTGRAAAATTNNNNNNNNINDSDSDNEPPPRPPRRRPATGVHLNDNIPYDEDIGGGKAWDASTRRSRSMVQPDTVATLSLALALRST